MALGVPEFRRALVKLGDALDSDVVKLVGAVGRLDVPAAMRLVTDAYPELASPYLALAADLTATWYEEQPASAGAEPFEAKPAELPAVEQLAANARWALTQSNPTTALQRSGQRQFFQQHRDTVLLNVEREGVGWAREARPGACGVCRVMATRVLTMGFGGAPGLYRSELTAGANPHAKDAEGHDGCRCVAVPIRGGEPYTVPGYVHDWLDDYEAVSRDKSGRLLSLWQIAAAMEQRGAMRGEPIEATTPSPALAKVVALDTARPKPASSTRAPDGSPLALPAAPVRLAIEARKVVQPPAPNAVADWLAANDQNWKALEAFRALDAIELPPAEREPDPGPVEPKTIGDQLLAALHAAQLARDEPDERRSATAKQKQQRKEARRIAVREAQRALDDAIADGTADQPTKRGKSRPFAEVEAERRAAADKAIDEAVAAFEAACAGGDDDEITRTCDAMEALEAAEQERRAAAEVQLAKIAEKHERQRARRQAEREAIQDEIARVAEENDAQNDEDYWLAEAEVMARRTGKSASDVLVAIRKREFVRQSAFKGAGFEDTLKNEFAHLVEQAYMQAEDATNGYMVRKGSKFDPKNLWYCNDATARRHMSEEMANWFDEHGRITLPVMREMVLSGENFAKLTVMNEDYNQ